VEKNADAVGLGHALPRLRPFSAAGFRLARIPLYRCDLVSPTASYLVETLVTLLAVVAVAVLVLVGAKRLGVGAPSGPIELVGRLPLDARRAVYLVRVADRVLVLGSSEAGLTKLHDLPSADVPRDVSVTSPFAAMLARVATSPKKKVTTETSADA
jgi:flagellar protein FliO/FliZ